MLSKTKWVSYKDREGPVITGTHKYAPDKYISDLDTYIAVIALAEGSCFDSVNMYDRGIVSVGLFQHIEANYYNVSNMLATLCNAGLEEHVMKKLQFPLRLSDATFKKINGRWGFYMKNGSSVNSTSLQKAMFYGCDGSKESWTPEARAKAISWCSSISSIFSESEQARNVQLSFVKSSIPQYIFKTAKTSLFYKTPEPTSKHLLTARAVYLGCAINAPGSCDSILRRALLNAPQLEFGEEWCNHIITSLITSKEAPQFAHRYARFAPYLKKTLTFIEEKTTLPDVAPEVAEKAVEESKFKVIQLEPQDIIVEIPKKRLIERMVDSFLGRKDDDDQA